MLKKQTLSTSNTDAPSKPAARIQTQIKYDTRYDHKMVPYYIQTQH